MKKYIAALFLILTIAIPVSAHSGRTDENGGHTDHSTGDYHWHHGEEAHQHYDIDGDGILDCPLSFRYSWDIVIPEESAYSAPEWTTATIPDFKPLPPVPNGQSGYQEQSAKPVSDHGSDASGVIALAYLALLSLLCVGIYYVKKL